MKKTVRIAAIALVAMSLTVACKSKAPEMVEDTMPEMEMVVDTIDTIEEVAEEVVTEEPVKKEVKKAETNAPKVTPTDISKQNNDGDQSAKGSGKKVEKAVTPTTTINVGEEAAPAKKKK